jgi:hypothetical protein
MQGENKYDEIGDPFKNVSRGIPHATKEGYDGYFCANPSITTNK